MMSVAPRNYWSHMLTVTHRWTCDCCPETSESDWHATQLPRTLPMQYTAPEGWRFVDGKLQCPKHGDGNAESE